MNDYEYSFLSNEELIRRVTRLDGVTTSLLAQEIQKRLTKANDRALLAQMAATIRCCSDVHDNKTAAHYARHLLAEIDKE